ncbi:hypothetical protein [uncultured Nostoc sp.]|uniref:hypothetical protein n=2 Tax=Nostoc TaxID=1177 RepID=UPI0035CBC473
MQYLVILTTKKKFETEGMPADFKEEHVKELVQGQVLYAQGLLRQSWELDLEQLGSKQHGAACIFEADSTQHLQGMIDSFPNVKTDYVDYQVFPLKPDPAYTQNI